MHNPEAIEVLATACQEDPIPQGEEMTSRSTPCFELFQHAITKDCQTAWSAVFQIYHRRVLRWARSSGACAPYEPEDIAQKAWEKFMHAAPEVFERFGGVIHILGYLKRCVKSVFIDQIRKAERDEKLERVLECEWVQVSSPEKLVLEKMISDQIVQEVYAQLDEQESLVFKLTFELDLTPRQIVEQSPHMFSDVRDIYRIKERAFRRLRSNPILRFLYDDL